MTTLPFFPQPYPDELFYSALARYKVRCGVLSDKLLSADVFGKQTVIASPEMPNGIREAYINVKPSIACSAIDIIRKHTLFPLYTAFSEVAIKDKVMTQMLGNSYNTYTTSLGLATCQLKSYTYFRYCPNCVVAQIRQYGEAFWDRRWFGFYTTCCPMHGVPLKNTKLPLNNIARHSFHPILNILSPLKINTLDISKAQKQDHLISLAAMRILSQPLVMNLTFERITNFYKCLAFSYNFNRGTQVKQNEVADFIKNFWSWKWLRSKGFTAKSFEYTMSCLFRKHRKQQLYLVHLIASLPFFNGHIDQWWQEMFVSDLAIQTRKANTNNTYCDKPYKQVNDWRKKWLTLVRQNGAKAARYHDHNSEKMYTALYRYDKNWLKMTNKLHPVKRTVRGERVDWNKRDYSSCKLLFLSLYEADDVFSPRRSKRWFLSHLANPASIEQNLYRLPLVDKFLNSYSESVHDYQSRRIIQAAREYAAQNTKAQPWQLYRKGRINTQRHISSQVNKTCEWCFNWLTDHIK